MASQITLASSRRSNIPPDVLREILLRLPGKALIRLKCVSRLWHSIISDPNFRPTKRRAVVMSYVRGATSFVSISNDLSVEILPFDPGYSSHKARFSTPYSRHYILGSCNGLILVKMVKGIFLWNPLTSYCQKVLELDLYFKNISYDIRLSGFVYDSSIDDYTVVVFLKGGRTISSHEMVIVACLKTKKWRQIKFPYGKFDSHNSPVPEVNGRLHWSVILGNELANKVVCFVSCANKFEMLPMPHHYTQENEKFFIYDLGVLDECLFMTLRRRPGIHEVWVMKEYGKKESWTCLLTFAIQNVYPRPLFYTENREALLFFIEDSKKLFTYSIGKQTWERKEVLVNDRSMCAVTYYESFNSPSGYDWDEKKHEGMASIHGLRWIDRFRALSRKRN